MIIFPPITSVFEAESTYMRNILQRPVAPVDLICMGGLEGAFARALHATTIRTAT
jgi:hypothetical protein